jgi:hypothetical protein
MGGLINPFLKLMCYPFNIQTYLSAHVVIQAIIGLKESVSIALTDYSQDDTSLAARYKADVVDGSIDNVF